jgi:MarR family 2-MHQ and catechol resistance regulon transcriptional repressor
MRRSQSARRAISTDTAESAESDSVPADNYILRTAIRYREKVPFSDILSTEVHLALGRAYRMVNAAATRSIEALNLRFTVTLARFTVLRILYLSKGHQLPQNEISREMSVSRTNITNLIDGLERLGLVVRVASLKDRRMMYARLTRKGVRLTGKLLDNSARLMNTNCAEFTDEEKIALRDFLYRFADDVATSWHLGGAELPMVENTPEP